MVTGIGVVSPIGIGREQFWQQLCAGRSGVAPIDSFAVPSDSPRLAAEIRGFVARDFIRSAHFRRMDKLSRMVVAAGRMALDDARNAIDGTAPDQVAVVVGSAFGNTAETDRHLERVFTRGPAAASPMIFPNLVLNAPASYVAMELGATGANLTVGQGETSAEQAIVLGSELIRRGRAAVVLAGGGDEFDALVHNAYRQARALSSQRGGPEWSSPYDLNRNGLVLGEGAAILVLESASRARARGATVYAEVDDDVIFGVSSPLYGWPRRAQGALAPLWRVLGVDGLVPCGVDLIVGSANSSPRLDGCEIDLFARVLGESAAGVRVTSLKGAVGEFGSAGALNAAAACLALREQTVPPLGNLRTPETGVPFRFAGTRGEARELRRALVYALARGGAGAAVVFKQFRDW